MKRIISMLLAGLLAASLASCGAAQTEDTATTGSIPSAVELLNTVWDGYGEEERFPVMGGDASEEHVNLEGPGIYSLDDPAAVDTTLGFPADDLDQIDDAASLLHMMNANTFTCGAYHVVEGTDLQALATAIQENIQGREWICGFPEQLILVTVEDYIVAFFGAQDLTDTFLTHLTDAYPTAQVVWEGPAA